VPLAQDLARDLQPAFAGHEFPFCLDPLLRRFLHQGCQSLIGLSFNGSGDVSPVVLVQMKQGPITRLQGGKKEQPGTVKPGEPDAVANGLTCDWPQCRDFERRRLEKIDPDKDILKMRHSTDPQH
jgi:hypothetical protein